MLKIIFLLFAKKLIQTYSQREKLERKRGTIGSRNDVREGCIVASTFAIYRGNYGAVSDSH